MTSTTNNFMLRIALLKQAMDLTYLQCQTLIQDIEKHNNVSVSFNKKLALDSMIRYLDEQIKEYKKASLLEI